jgi:hypothetical protein
MTDITIDQDELQRYIASHTPDEAARRVGAQLDAMTTCLSFYWPDTALARLRYRALDYERWCRKWLSRGR